MGKEIIKLNVGCGPSGIPGWLNYDWGALPLLSKLSVIRRILVVLGLLQKRYVLNWPNLKLVDIRRRFPLEDRLVKYIYCSHVLEHFDRWKARRILSECHRVLENGGVIRIVVPEIGKMFQFYRRTRNRPGRELNRLWWGFRKDEEPKNFIQKLSRKFIRSHQWNYDADELRTLLKEAGFSKINLCAFQKGSAPDIKTLDLKSHRNHSLYMEAIKV